MSLFDNIESNKDNTPIEKVGVMPTQPASLVYSVDERKEWGMLLKKAMKEEYGEEAKSKNYSDFFLDLLRKHYS